MLKQWARAQAKRLTAFIYLLFQKKKTLKKHSITRLFVGNVGLDTLGNNSFKLFARSIDEFGTNNIEDLD